MRTLLAAAVALFALPAFGQSCWRPIFPYRAPYYYGYGYGRYSDNAVAIAGIAAATRVVETALVTQSRPRTVVVERPVVYRQAPATREPAPARAIPFGFRCPDGGLRSPWSAFTLAPKTWAPGRIYYDAFTGESFLGPA